MAFYPSTSLHRRVPMQGPKNSPDFAFFVLASIGLIGLAILSIALGVAPVVDPTIFPVP